MSTDPNEPSKPSSDSQISYTAPDEPTLRQDVEDPVVDIVSTMQSVDTDSPESQLNATSMEDNNGGRIEFNEDYDVSENNIK